jgi:uncharacterized protein (TIGR03435 family)
MRLCLVLWFVAASCGAFAQQFEVASIKPAEPSPMGQIRVGMRADAGMLRYSNVSLKDCIRNAYRVKDFQVKGPDFIESARFDITAKLPDGASQDQIPEMLQALLAERFKLTLHHESKEHAVYALVAGKGGLKLKPAEVTAGPAAGPAGPPPGPGAGGLPRGGMMVRMDEAGAHLKSPSVTLSNFAEMLSRFSERPVVDMTGIQGQYDFDLVFTPEVMHGPGRMMAGSPPPNSGEAPAEKAASMQEAVQKYGLKMEPRKAPMDLLIIDHIENTPTEN